MTINPSLIAIFSDAVHTCMLSLLEEKKNLRSIFCAINESPGTIAQCFTLWTENKWSWFMPTYLWTSYFSGSKLKYKLTLMSQHVFMYIYQQLKAEHLKLQTKPVSYLHSRLKTVFLPPHIRQAKPWTRNPKDVFKKSYVFCRNLHWNFTNSILAAAACFKKLMQFPLINSHRWTLMLMGGLVPPSYVCVWMRWDHLPF